MNMMLIDPKLLDQLEGSTCFGVAHDPTARECKGCDVQQECAARTTGNRVFDPVKTLNPETETALQKAQEEQKEKERKKKEKAEKKSKAKKAEPSDMPDFRGLDVDELWKILKERGGTCKEYDNVGIQKMRLVMAIKKTYEK